MNDRFLADARNRPDLFQLNSGGDDPGHREDGRWPVEAWLRSHSWSAPADLIHLWQHYGAGASIFESETLLGPFGDPAFGDDVLSVNELLAAKGMPGEYLVFHLGLGGLTAVRLTDRCYVQLDADDFSERAVFPTFDEWYRGVLRAEYKRHATASRLWTFIRSLR